MSKLLTGLSVGLVVTIIIVSALALNNSSKTVPSNSSDLLTPFLTQATAWSDIVPANSTTSANTGVRSDSLNTVMSINASRLELGQFINISVWDVNTSYQNLTLNVPTNSSHPREIDPTYPAPGMTLAPCLDFVMPAIYEGHYTQSNISEAVPLQLFYPAGTACPISHYALSYTIAPDSDSVVYNNLGAEAPYVDSISIKGYYVQGHDNCLQDNGTVIASCPQLVPFSAGEYTVAGGDLWGGLVLLYIIVS